VLGVELLAAVAVTCLPGSPPGAALPSWSPGGEQAAYTVPAEESARIEVARPGTIRPVEGDLSYDSAPTQLAWSPTGEKIAFEKRTGAISVWGPGRFGGGIREVVHAEAGTVTELGDWSPDGRALVFARDGHLHVVDVVTGDVRYLVDGLHPTWSPDGREIAYAAADEIRAIAPDGESSRTIAVTSTPVADIAWSPDSTRLAFLGPVIGIVARFAGDPVYTAPAQPPIAWRPNGIAYSLDAGIDGSEVYRYDPDTGAAVRLTHLPLAYDAHFVDASRDGLHVAYELDVGSVHAGVRIVDGARDGPLLACHGTQRPDRVRGSRLNDLVRINGGGSDRVSCGRGRDVVYADRRDRVARDCENVTRLP
jgi:dipeptidyl aminopeptidase/acylaminoacyl peptidase